MHVCPFCLEWLECVEGGAGWWYSRACGATFSARELGSFRCVAAPSEETPDGTGDLLP